MNRGNFGDPSSPVHPPFRGAATEVSRVSGGAPSASRPLVPCHSCPSAGLAPSQFCADTEQGPPRSATVIGGLCQTNSPELEKLWRLCGVPCCPHSHPTRSAPLHSSSPNPLWTMQRSAWPVANIKHNGSHRLFFCETYSCPSPPPDAIGCPGPWEHCVFSVLSAPDCNIPMKQWLTAGSSCTRNTRGEQSR